VILCVCAIIFVNFGKPNQLNSDKKPVAPSLKNTSLEPQKKTFIF